MQASLRVLLSGWLVGAASLATLGSGAAAALGPGPGFNEATDRCAAADVLCVDDTAGPGQEFSSIQAAVDRGGPGVTVLVFEGSYEGFRVRRGGSREAPLHIAAASSDVRVVGDEPVAGEDNIYIENASYVILEGFTVLRDGRRGNGIGAHDARAETPMRGLVIRNNDVHGAGGTNIYLSQVADSVIEGNIAAEATVEHGIYLSNAGSDNTVLRGNNVYGNRVNGIHFNGDDRYGGDGLQWGLTVEGNIVHHNQANGLNMDGVQYSRIRNNLVFANGRHGLRAYAIDAADGPRMLTIVNNTFFGNASWAVKLTQDGGRHTIFNNILLSDAGSLVVDNPLVSSDYNIVGDRLSIDGEQTVLSLSTWQALGNDASSRIAVGAELFRSIEGRDFRLLPGAPALDSGGFMVNGQLAPDIDLFGSIRPSAGGYDIGAVEAGAERPSGAPVARR